MKHLFLKTKLVVPRPQPQRILRPRLMDRLAQAASYPMALLSAPAGFGKTTVLGEWAASLDPASIRLAWLSLDEDDNDPTRFISYLVAALEQVFPTIGDEALTLLQAPEPQAPRQALTALLWTLSRVLEHDAIVALVLDNYSVIQNQAVHEGMIFLIEHLPPGLHLLIATRVDPPFPLGRLRAAEWLAEVRAADLRFSLEEEGLFLKQRTGLVVDHGTLLRLDARLEGWAAGLQLISLAIRNEWLSRDIDQVIQVLSGNSRHVADYLVEEVLHSQPADIQAFLLQTSILDQLNGPLCHAVTGRDDSAQLLDQLERANMFITPIDPEHRWYRYHPLFADLLRLRLEQADAGWKSEYGSPAALHRQAAAWLGSNGMLDSAIRHALSANAIALAAQWIAQAGEMAWIDGAYATLLRWLKTLPQTARIDYPRLGILFAWGVALTGQADQLALAEADLDQIESRLRPHGDQDETYGMLCTVRSVISSGFRLDNQTALTFSRLALQHLPESNRVWRGAAAVSLGHVYHANGDVKAATAAYAEALRLNQSAGNLQLTLRSRIYLFIQHYYAGRLTHAAQEGEAILKQSAGLSEASQPMVAGAHLYMSYIYYEWNRLDEAMSEIDQTIHLGQRWNNQITVISGWTLKTIIYKGMGDAAGVEAALAESRRLACSEGLSSLDFLLQVDALQASIWLRDNQTEMVTNWVSGKALPSEPEVKNEYPNFVLARALVRAGQTDQAIEFLEKTRQILEVHGRHTTLVEVLLILAQAYYAAGRETQAFEALQRALELGEAEGFLRAFVDEGRPLYALLPACLPRLSSTLRPYARKLSFAFDHLGGVIASDIPARTANAALIEPLTGREMEILKLIAKGLSNAEIAQSLYLALNTVKAHTKNIYSKLDVNSRAQAIRRGQELKLL